MEKKYLVIGDGRVFMCYIVGQAETRVLIGKNYKAKQ